MRELMPCQPISPESRPYSILGHRFMMTVTPLASALAAAAWWLVGRRRNDATGTAVTIGYADGSAVTLEAGSPELDRLIRIAAGAATP